MPTIDISLNDLNSLIGKNFSISDLEKDDGFPLVKGEIDGIEKTKKDTIIKLDIKDTNRPDLWSVEGVARVLKSFHLGKQEHYNISKNKKHLVSVEKSVEKIRPFVVCAVIRDIKITEESLIQIIQLQEKMHGSFGRKRKEVAMGIYDYDKIKWPIEYKAVDPKKYKFVPLEFNEKLTLSDILKRHPKGKEFANILENSEKYPIFMDSSKNILSMPPIINSNYSGKVTEATKNLFIEVTGTKEESISTALHVIVAALADRAGKIESVKVQYKNRAVEKPDFKLKRVDVGFDIIDKFGLGLSREEISNLLKKYGYSVKPSGDKLELGYPAYRQDIMHPIDAVEDVIIARGFNKIVPETPKFLTKGSIAPIEEFTNSLANFSAGFGMQEISTFTLTNKDNLFKKMNLKDENIVELENPMSSNWSCLRNWLLPSVMEFLSKNTNKPYPQKVFEIGECVNVNSSMETGTETLRKLSCAFVYEGANLTEIKSVAESILKYIGVEYEISKMSHPSFIESRSGSISANGSKIGFFGEIHPSVLKNFGIELPVVALEIQLDALVKKV